METVKRRVIVVSSGAEAFETAVRALEPYGFSVSKKPTAKAALRALKGGEVVLLDLPKGQQSEELGDLRAAFPELPVILAVEGECPTAALDGGVYDCLGKPVEPVRLVLSVRNAFASIGLRERATDGAHREGAQTLLIKRPVMRQIGRIQGRETNVLIVGEQGTGKELVARAIHEGGFRRSCPFVMVDGRDERLGEALFGSPSGPGRIVEAEGGTLFVREPGALDDRTREGLSLFLKERRFRPGMNGSDPIRADVRVICSIAERPDEWFTERFPSVLELQPLRKRRDDIVPLAEEFLAECSGEFGTGAKRLTPEALAVLRQYAWPGNAGELKNAMRKAALLSQGEAIEPRHLVLDGGAHACSAREFLEIKLQRFIKDMARHGRSDLHKTVIGEFEKALLDLVLHETGGNQMKSAVALGISRTTLRSKMRLYGITGGEDSTA